MNDMKRFLLFVLGSFLFTILMVILLVPSALLFEPVTREQILSIDCQGTHINVVKLPGNATSDGYIQVLKNDSIIFNHINHGDQLEKYNIEKSHLILYMCPQDTFSQFTRDTFDIDLMLGQGD